MHSCQGFNQRISKLENDLTNLILLEQQTSFNSNCLCDYHRNALEKVKNHPHYREVSQPVKSCPNYEQHDYYDNAPRQKRRSPVRTCNCGRELRRPCSSPTPSFYANDNAVIGLEPVTTQHIDSNESRRSREVLENSSRGCSSNGAVKNSSHRSVNRASSCPLKARSRSSSKSPSRNEHGYPRLCSSDDIEQLKDEVSQIRKQIDDMNNGKKEALEVTELLKAKYHKLIQQKEHLHKHIEKMKQENEVLTQELKQSMKLHRASAEEAKDAKNLLNMYKEQASAFHEQATKNAKIIAETKDKFCKCLEAKDNHIKELKDKNEGIMKQIQEKESTCKKLSTKCEVINSSCDEKSEKMQQLTQSNEKLCQCIKSLEEQLECAVDEANSTKNELSCRVKEIEGLKQEFSDKCACYDKERNALNKKLNDTGKSEKDLSDRLNTLMKRIEELEKQVCGEECQNIRRENIEMRNKIEELIDDLNSKLICGDECQKLRRENKQLSKTVDDLKQEMGSMLVCGEACQKIRQENQRLNKSVKEMQEEMDNMLVCGEGCQSIRRENQRLSKLVKDLEEETSSMLVCGEECQNIRRENQRLSKLVKELEQEINTMLVCGEECQNIRNENKRLSHLYNEMEKKLKELEEGEKKSNKCMQQELEKCTKVMNEKEKSIIKERNELRRLVEELTNVVKQNKVTLLQLSTVNKQQEHLLKEHEASLDAKDEQLRYAETELKRMRLRTAELEHQVVNFRNALQKLEICQAVESAKCPAQDKCIEPLRAELEDTKIALQVEKENTLVKQKIMDDQAKTICCMKCKIKEQTKELMEMHEELIANAEEVKKLRLELREARHDLEIQIKAKEQLLNEIQQVDEQKNMLTDKVNELEYLVTSYCNNEQNNVSRQQQLTVALEQQVQVQRREFELQKQVLTKEKDKAVHAARFATEKLLETVADFQKQVDTHKHIQAMLTSLLQEKEEKLQMVTTKISSITAIAHSARVEDIDKEATHCLTELYKRSDTVKNYCCASPNCKRRKRTTEYGNPEEWNQSCSNKKHEDY